jgi:hypothetical protein
LERDASDIYEMLHQGYEEYGFLYELHGFKKEGKMYQPASCNEVAEVMR